MTTPPAGFPPGSPDPVSSSPELASAGGAPSCCAACDALIDGESVQDSEHVAWLGRDGAAKFCSIDCLDAYAESNSLAGRS